MPSEKPDAIEDKSGTRGLALFRTDLDVSLAATGAPLASQSLR